jgi:hypothetical protein
MNTTVVEGSALWAIFVPYILPVAGTVISALLGWVLTRVGKKFGLQIENSRRDAFQTALTNATGLLIQRLGSRAASAIHLDVKSPAVASAIAYVERSAPDAIAKFGVTPEAIAMKIEAKLGLLTGTPDDPSGGAVASMPITAAPGGSGR